MNLEKSLRSALFKNNKKINDVAIGLNVTYQHASRWCNGGNITINNLKKLADFFDMKLSEFIALGEPEV